MTNSFRFSLKIALRYLWSGRSEAAITIITIISILGVAVGVITINVVMAVMTGFQYELREKILGADAHILVRPLNGNIKEWEPINKDLSTIPGIIGVTPFTQSQALLKGGDKASGIIIKGLTQNSDSASQIQKYLDNENRFGKQDINRLFKTELEEPSREDNEKQEINNINDKQDNENNQELENSSIPGIIIGNELARGMGIFIGDIVSLLSPQVSSTPFGLVPKLKRFKIVGVFKSGLIEYESGLAYTNLAEAQSFFRLGKSITGFEIRIKDINEAPEIAKNINLELNKFQGGLFAQDWTQTNKAFFDAMALEKNVYFIVLLLIIVMASFSIVSSLVMLVIEKRKDIAILKTLGATGSSISNIFKIQGAIIGAIGVFSGLILSYCICISLREYGFPIDERIFQMSKLPIRIEPINFFLTGISAFLICCIATLYPSKKSGRIEPIEILRYQ